MSETGGLKNGYVKGADNKKEICTLIHWKRQVMTRYETPGVAY